jgi:hypothetical protein
MGNRNENGFTRRLVKDANLMQEMESRNIDYYFDQILRNWKYPKKIQLPKEIEHFRLLNEYDSIFHYK